MNRPIKFRAWDGKSVWFNQFTVTSIGNINKSEPAREWHSWKNENWVLIQFTGLLDKNGVEIYEGDIIQYHHKYTGLVHYCSDQGRWNLREPNNLENALGWLNYESVEVIGNIHENPELLKVSDATE